MICGTETNGLTCGTECRKRLSRLREVLREERKCSVCGVVMYDRRKKCTKCQKKTKLSAFDRPFSSWDGEGEDGKFTLLANERGDYVADRRGLGTIDCLEFLLDSAKRDMTNVWYGFGYDVGMILKDIPMHGPKRTLEQLWDKGTTKWRGYTITYMPRKMFSVWHKRTARVFSSYDVIGFFQQSFIKTCLEWLCTHKPVCEADIEGAVTCTDIPPIIIEGKMAREKFNTWDLDKIIRYNAEECRLLSIIMHKFREALRGANLPVARWDGAGAVAAAWLRRENARQWYGTWPPEMQDGLARSYFGGRSDILGPGLTDCANLDINSAYPAGMCECPDLSRLTWSLCDRPSTIGKYDLCHVTWNIPFGEKWGPFPWRWKKGSISFPLQGEGWYFGVEVSSAQRRFGNRVKVLQAWRPEGNFVFPLAPLIRRDYDTRARLKREGSPVQVPIKLGLNSLYGKVLQRHGYGNKPPRWKNMVWGSYITAYTRAKLNDVIGCGADVIATATDGVFCRNPSAIPAEWISSTKELGKWEVDKDVASIAILGAGVYETYNSAGESQEKKQRGFGSLPIDYAGVLRAWHLLPGGSEWPGTFTLRRFVGIGIALRQHKKWGPWFGHFVDMERELSDPSTVGTPKRLPTFRGEVFKGLRELVPAQVPLGVASHPYKWAESESIVDEKLAEAECVGD